MGEKKTVADCQRYRCDDETAPSVITGMLLISVDFTTNKVSSIKAPFPRLHQNTSFLYQSCLRSGLCVSNILLPPNTCADTRIATNQLTRRSMTAATCN
jgi:hypothetical protein